MTSAPRLFVFGLLALSFAFAAQAFAQPSRGAAHAGGATKPRPDAAYRVRSGDKLGVKFVYHPELSDAAVLVRPDGFISLPLVDDIRAAGLTTGELKAKIERAYAESLVDPVIVVSLVEYVAPRVFVGGQVSKPGSYELRQGQTVMQALIVAGGFTREAHRKTVLHARPAAGGNLKITVVDITKLLKPGGADRELALQDGDYVFVPDSKLSRFSQMADALRFAVPGFGFGLQ
jgi:protein involved in polysaccharide export with SLBB domain